MSPNAPFNATDVASIKQQLQDLQQRLEAGTVSREDHDQQRAALERQILEWALRDQPAAALHGAASESPAARSTGPRYRLAAGALVVLVGLAAAFYGITRGDAWRKTTAPAGPATVEATAQPHATNSDQINAMVERLAARLKANPADAGGWAMLARSYGVLGRTADAVDAYDRAEKLTPNDAGLLVDYADALAVQNDRVLAGEPMRLIERALKIEPQNAKGLAMAGSEAFARKDFKKAVKYWDALEAAAGADNMFVQQIQSQAAQARNSAGLPPKVVPVDKTPLPDLGAKLANAPTAPAAAAPTKSLSGTVSLAAKLSKNASPDDTVFIFARAAEGSRMPLAILRKQVKDLPVQFSLDDSTGMGGGTRLSQAGRVVVGARVSKSGQAMPSVGDLSGQSDPVAVRASGLKIEINEVVSK